MTEFLKQAKLSLFRVHFVCCWETHGPAPKASALRWAPAAVWSGLATPSHTNQVLAGMQGKKKSSRESLKSRHGTKISEKGRLGTMGTGAGWICMLRTDQGPQRESSKWGECMRVSGTEESAFKHLHAFNPHRQEKVNQECPRFIDGEHWGSG